jgi:hypothetical protein
MFGIGKKLSALWRTVNRHRDDHNRLSSVVAALEARISPLEEERDSDDAPDRRIDRLCNRVRALERLNRTLVSEIRQAAKRIADAAGDFRVVIPEPQGSAGPGSGEPGGAA